MKLKRGAAMRMSLRGGIRTLALAGLVLEQQARAGDDTNAALITDGTIWAQSMQQVMGGTSVTVGGSTIRGPAGIYVNVLLSRLLPTAEELTCPGASLGEVCMNTARGPFSYELLPLSSGKPSGFRAFAPGTMAGSQSDRSGRPAQSWRSSFGLHRRRVQRDSCLERAKSGHAQDTPARRDLRLQLPHMVV